MPSKTKLKNAAIAERSAALPRIPPELLDQIAGATTAEAIQDVTMALKKAPIEVPRDRHGSFEPLLIAKHERRFTGLDDKIVALYERGMTVREIRAFLAEQYGCEVSPEFISSVTDAVMAEVTAWQARPLEPMYPVVFFDTLKVKVREDAVVRNKAIDLALGVLADGTRDILGLWIENTEGAKFWMKVFNDLKTRGVGDILIAVTDGLKGIPWTAPTGTPDLDLIDPSYFQDLATLIGTPVEQWGVSP